MTGERGKEIEAALEQYEELRQNDLVDAAAVLRKLRGDLDEQLLPYVRQLEERAVAAEYTTRDFVNSFLAAEEPALTMHMTDFGKARSSAKILTNELAESAKLLAATLRPKDRQRLLQAIRHKEAVLDGLVKEMEGHKTVLHDSHRIATELLPLIENVFGTVSRLRGKLMRVLTRLLLADVQSSLSPLIAIAVAFGLTVLLDRFTPLVETLGQTFVPHGSHDLVMLLLFAVQVAILEPVKARANTKLLWRNFDIALAVADSALADLRRVDREIVEAEHVLGRLREEQEGLTSA